MTSQRRRVNIYDYPEHLNPFYEGDNHNFIRFKNIRKVVRSNSFSFQSVRDFKNTLSRSFRIKNRRGSKSSEQSEEFVNNDNVGSIINKPKDSLTNSCQGVESDATNYDRIRNSKYDETYSPRSRYLSSNHVNQDSNNISEKIPPSPKVQSLPRRKKRAPLPPVSPNLEKRTPNANSENLSDDSDKQIEKFEESQSNTPRTSETSVPDITITDSKESLVSVELTKTSEAETDDASDLLEMVQKLQKEVEKLTGDTNNNMITPSCDSETN